MPQRKKKKKKKSKPKTIIGLRGNVLTISPRVRSIFHRKGG